MNLVKHLIQSFLIVALIILGSCQAAAITPPGPPVVIVPEDPIISVEPSDIPVFPGPVVEKPDGLPENLRVLSWAGFSSAVSFTFDDANASQIFYYETLNNLEVPFTFYMITKKDEASDPVWIQALADGHELGSHSHSHLLTATLADLDTSINFIQTKFGITPYTMAGPNGATAWTSLAPSRFLINRGASGGFMKPDDNVNPFNIYTYIPSNNVTSAILQTKIDETKTEKAWRTVLVHGFTGCPISDGAYQPIAIDQFCTAVTYAKNLGDIWLDTVVSIGSYWCAEKMLNKIVPVYDTDTEVTTWTWTLPDHFPPQKYLRILVDGGVVKQNGKIVPWNNHGFYEIALDEGSLTLSK